jgi:hypothetical protein
MSFSASPGVTAHFSTSDVVASEVFDDEAQPNEPDAA